MLEFVKSTLSNILNNYSKFFIHLRPHPELVIGKRGLVGDEVKQGIVIVFGPQSYRNLEYFESFFTVEMQFSGKWELLIVPFQSISAMFNDPIDPQFMFNINMPEVEAKKDVKLLRDLDIDIDFNDDSPDIFSDTLEDLFETENIEDSKTAHKNKNENAEKSKDKDNIIKFDFKKKK